MVFPQHQGVVIVVVLDQAFKTYLEGEICVLMESWGLANRGV